MEGNTMSHTTTRPRRLAAGLIVAAAATATTLLGAAPGVRCDAHPRQDEAARR
jgi:hypothetical protein